MTTDDEEERSDPGQTMQPRSHTSPGEERNCEKENKEKNKEKEKKKKTKTNENKKENEKKEEEKKFQKEIQCALTWYVILGLKASLEAALPCMQHNA